MNFKRLTIVLLLLVMQMTCGCATLGMAVLYKRVNLPDKQIVKNIPYTNTVNSDPILNRLDLFLPEGENWPTMVFVHGGGWNTGDKDLKVAGADVYSNIGRYFASQGIGTAIISYRLVPGVDWKTQLLDVAQATAWVYEHIEAYKGDPKAIFIAGHSAGAQLATRVALDPSFLGTFGLSPHILCGVIPISGVGYNFLNDEMYTFGKKHGSVKALFNKKELSHSLREKMSLIFYTKETSPPFLVLYAAGDKKEIRHASLRLDDALKADGAQRQIYRVPKVGHASMVLALSHANKFPANMMMVFMRTCECGRSSTKVFNSAPTAPAKLIKSPI